MLLTRESGSSILELSHLSSYKSNHRWMARRLSRYRWNVLDLLTVFSGKAVTCHLFCDIDMSWVEEMRKQYEAEGHKLTVTAFILKAIGLAQKSHPASRTFYLPGLRMVTYRDIVAGFTVEKEVEGEPIVFFGEIEEPHLKSLTELADDLRSYSDSDIMAVKKLRQQVLFARMPWIFRQLIWLVGAWFPSFRLLCMGATFGVSSLGALGVNLVCGPSVLTSVFGVGAVEERVVARHGKPETRPTMTLALCFDNRAMDGAQAARFLSDVKGLLEGGLANY